MLNLKNTTLRVVTRLENQYAYDVEVARVGTNESDGNISYQLIGGFAAGLVQELSLLLNFRIELVTDLPDLTYKFEETHNYSVDLYAASYSLREDWLVHVEGTHVIGRSKAQVFLNRAFEGSMTDVVVGPIKPTAWLLLLVLSVVLSITFCCITKITEGMRISNALFHISSIFISQDGKIDVNSTPSKLTVLTASVAAFLLMSTYSAKIVSIATVKISSINSLAELTSSIYDLSFDLGYGNGSVLQYYTEQLSSSNPVMSKVLQKTQESKFRYESFEKSMMEVQRRPFAYIIDEETGYSSAEKALKRIPCELGTISFAGVWYPWTMLMRRGFIHKPAINYGILKLGETGIINYLEKRWIPGRVGSRDGCVAGDSGDFSGIHLTQLQTIFGVLTAGGFVACAILAVEKWTTRRKCHSLSCIKAERK